MSERPFNLNRKVRPTSAGLGLAIALASPALVACTGGERPAPDTPAATATENPEAKRAREQREAFLDQFNHIAAPTEVIAQPLAVTDEARQREKALFAIEDDPSPGDYEYDHDLAIAKRAIRSTTDPDVKADARRYLNQELAQGAVGAVAYDTYTYDSNKGLIKDNDELIGDVRDQLSLISNDALRKRAADLVNRTLVDEAVSDRDDKLSKAEAALLMHVPDELRKLAEEMVKSDDTYQEFSQKLHTDRTKLDGENSGFVELYDGAAYHAADVNDALKAYRADRAAHDGDARRPGVKDIALNELNFTTPEEARIAKGNLLAMPDQYQEVETEALKAFDGKILDELDDLLETPDATTTDEVQDLIDTARGYVDLVIGEKAKKLATALMDGRLAQLYAELGDEDDDKKYAAKRDQLILSQLPDSSKAKKAALRLRGGADDTYVLKDIVDTASLAADSANSNANEKLMTGSNTQAEWSINKPARDYLKANQG